MIGLPKTSEILIESKTTVEMGSHKVGVRMELLILRVSAALRTTFRYASMLFTWLTPRFWIFRRNKERCLEIADSLLPNAYDPVAVEIPLRAIRLGNAGGASINAKWCAGVTDHLNAATAQRRLVAIGAAEMGLQAVRDVATGFAAIDTDLYSAIGHLRGAQIENLSDLSSTLQNYHDASWAGNFPSHGGSIDNVHGHVGEFLLKRHLEATGLHVDVPEHANNPGWDLLVKGHHLDVKAAVKDASSSSIHDHFAVHPDIPVVVAGDIPHLPIDAIHFNHDTAAGLEPLFRSLESGAGRHQVFVDDSLSYDALHDHVHSGTSAAMGGTDVVHPHFPLVTFALSGIREISLLANGKTDPITALKHSALDVTGSGFGGFAGAKTGMLLGSFLGPIGAAVGGVVGAIGGAYAARACTDGIKRRSLNEATMGYELAVSRLRQRAEVEEASATKQILRLKVARQRELTQLAVKARHEFDAAVFTLQEFNDSTKCMTRADALEILQKAIRELLTLRDNLNERRRLHTFWQRFIWPDVSLIAEAKAISFVNDIYLQMREYRARLRLGEPLKRSELLDCLGQSGTAKASVVAYLDALYAEKRQRQDSVQALVDQWVDQLTDKRTAAMKFLREQIEELTVNIKKALAPLIKEVETRRETATVEAQKLGLIA